MAQTRSIMNDIQDRSFKLKNIYNTEKTKLQASYRQRIGEIQQWFYEQQQSLRGAKGELAVKRGQDLALLSTNALNRALEQINLIREEVSNRKSALESWAMSNATNLQQLKQNLAGIANFNPSLPQAQPIVGQIQASGGNVSTPSVWQPGSAYSKDEDKLFGGSSSGSA